MNLRHRVSKALVARGFRRNPYGTHLLRLSDGFSFWIDTGAPNRRPDIAPYVGIRHDEVERLAAELIGLEYHEWNVTVGGNVGYVNGEGYRWWEEGDDKDDVLRALDQAMDRLRPYLRLDRLIDAWDLSGSPNEILAVYPKVTIMLLTQADPAAILRYLDEEKPRWLKLGDEVAGQFLGFDARVRRRLAGRQG